MRPIFALVGPVVPQTRNLRRTVLLCTVGLATLALGWPARPLRADRHDDPGKRVGFSRLQDEQARLLWENRGQPGLGGTAFAVDVQGDVVVATGSVVSGKEVFAADGFVRALDAMTGATLWEDRFGSPDAEDRAQAVAVNAGRVFAAGRVSSAERGSDLLVRGYDLRCGTLLWERRVDGGGRIELGNGAVAHGGRVFVVGRVRGATGSSDFAILAFDARTGEPLWGSVTDPSGGRTLDIAHAVRVEGDMVYVAGTLSGTTGGSSLLVRAHDAETGAVQWQDEVPGAANSYDSGNEALAVLGHLLFVGGQTLNAQTDNPEDWMVRAYDAKTGALVWVDQADLQAFDSVTALSVGDGRLFAAGYDCDDTLFNCHLDVRAYDPRTGALRWEDRFNEPGGDIVAGPGAATVEAHGGRVFVGGAVLNANDRYEWTLRAYDARTAALEWEDRVDAGGSWSQPRQLKAQGNRLYAAGFMTEADETFDFTVRAYKTRQGRPRGWFDCDDDGDACH